MGCIMYIKNISLLPKLLHPLKKKYHKEIENYLFFRSH